VSLREIPAWFKIATVFLVLAPASLDAGLWLIFPELNITGNACISCSPSIGFNFISTWFGALVTVIAAVFFLIGLLLFTSSIGLFASKNNVQAIRWLRWLGRLKPDVRGQELLLSSRSNKYRRYALVILIAIFVQAILLIPGIGEDRQYSLSQFSTLYFGPSGALFYFFAMIIGISGFVLIYYHRPGGYLLAIIFVIIGLGTSTLDMLGLLPPSAPTFRTDLLALLGFPLGLALVYSARNGFRTSLNNGPSEGIARRGHDS
jgi:hypothetical protein